jgi:signal transduction histidine kinase
MTDDKVNILLVDDQPGKLLTYEAILSGLGENLIKANSGHEALQVLLKTDVAVVLVDVCMPNIDGYELATLIREHPRCRRAAIIFISAIHLTNLDQLKGYQCGAVDYVQVPVVPEILRARVTVFADLYRKTRQLERLNQDLESRVAERTAELEHDLAERKRLEMALKDTDRRKDEFLALLAHELRNPLAPIRSAIEIMKLKSLDDPDLRHCRSVIERQTDQLTRLVDDLLDVSRITRGKIRLEKSQVEVASIVARAVETNRALLDTRHHELRIDLPSEPLYVDGDMTRLSQVVGNLLNNAAKYTDEGGRIFVHAEREQRRNGDSEMVLRVRDTGVGIPAANLPNVFDLFTQLDHTLHRTQGGLGIGLALVRALVEMHGGRVTAHSDGIGHGSEFTVALPVHADGAVPEAGAVDDAHLVLQHRVLVVDDNRDSAETLAMVLRMHGSEVVTAHDGAAALRAAAQFRPDIVLLDIGMPEMDGYEVARHLRREPWGEGVLLVAQTGWGQPEDRRRTRDAGFDLHVTKPIDYAKLAQLLAGKRPAVSDRAT